MKQRGIDFHECKNPGCRKCPPDARKENTEAGLCELTTSCVDGGRIRCVGAWTREKVHFLTQYFGIFAVGMKDEWQGNLHYIELCSGPGRCVDRASGIEMDGSALGVLGHEAFRHIRSATFLDHNPDVVDALSARINSMDLSTRARAILADYHDAKGIAKIASERVLAGLVLVFLDPTDCGIPFETVAALAEALPKTDFIINVALGTDANRNVKAAILKKDSRVRSKYTAFLGGDDFFHDPAMVAMAKAGQDEKLRHQFRDSYQGAMRNLGYRYFGTKIVKHYYDLLFACRHVRGLTLWKKAQKYGPDNQATFDQQLE